MKIMRKLALILTAVMFLSVSAFAEDTVLEWYINFGWYGGEWGRDLVTKEITKETGVKAKYVIPAGDGIEKLNTMIASNSLPDMITIGWWEPIVQTLIKGKLVYSYDELAQKYDPDLFNVASKEKMAWYRQPDGKTYGYPNASWTINDIKNAKTATSNYSFLVRKDIYEALGKPDMSTPEGFLNALKKAKEKFPSVNGQPLIPIGFQEFGSGEGSLGQYFQDLLGIPYEKDGKIYDRKSDPEYAKWLKVLRKANEMKLLSNDIFVDKRQQIEDKMAQGRYFAIMYPWIDAQQPLTYLYENFPDKMYISIQGPRNSNKDLKPIYPGPGISGWTVTLITKNCKDPAAALKLAKFMISQKGQELCFLGKKGVTYDIINGKARLLPEIEKLKETNRKEYDQKYGIDYMNWMFMDNAMQDRLWPQENKGPLAQVKAFTFDKLTSLVAYDGINPQPTEKEGIVAQKIYMKWVGLLPKLITAKSDADFDNLYNKFLEEQKKLGIDQVLEYQTKKMQENKKKLGI